MSAPFPIHFCKHTWHPNRGAPEANVRQTKFKKTVAADVFIIWAGTVVWHFDLCHHFLRHLCCVWHHLLRHFCYWSPSLSSARSHLSKLLSLWWWWRGDVAKHFSESGWHAGISSNGTVRAIGRGETREVINIWGRERFKEKWPKDNYNRHVRRLCVKDKETNKMTVNIQYKITGVLNRKRKKESVYIWHYVQVIWGNIRPLSGLLLCLFNTSCTISRFSVIPQILLNSLFKVVCDFVSLVFKHMCDVYIYKIANLD